MKKINTTTATGEPGDRIHVILSCRQGCCEESNFKGTIVAIEQNGSYQVLNDKNLQKVERTPEDMVWNILERGISPYNFKFVGFENIKAEYLQYDSDRSGDCLTKEQLKNVLRLKKETVVPSIPIVKSVVPNNPSRFSLLEVE